MLFMRGLWKEPGFPAYQDIPELCPVLVVFIDQKRHAGHCPDVLQTCESFPWNTLRFLVYRRVEQLAVISKADRYDVRPTLGIRCCKPRNSCLFELFPDRTGTHRFGLTNRACLSRTPMISSRVRSGIPRIARWIPCSRYSARTASS